MFTNHFYFQVLYYKVFIIVCIKSQLLFFNNWLLILFSPLSLYKFFTNFHIQLLYLCFLCFYLCFNCVRFRNSYTDCFCTITRFPLGFIRFSLISVLGFRTFFRFFEKTFSLPFYHNYFYMNKKLFNFFFLV